MRKMKFVLTLVILSMLLVVGCSNSEEVLEEVSGDDTEIAGEVVEKEKEENNETSNGSSDDNQLVEFVNNNDDDVVIVEMLFVDNENRTSMEEYDYVDYFGEVVLTIKDIKERAEQRNSSYLDEVKYFVISEHVVNIHSRGEDEYKLRYSSDDRGLSYEDFKVIYSVERFSANFIDKTQEFVQENLVVQLEWDVDVVGHENLSQLIDEIDFSEPPESLRKSFEKK